MKIDDFFTKELCDRCKSKLYSRIMSWFTKETICMDCSDKETWIKRKLAEQGKDVSYYEGIGYVPNPERR